VQGQMVLDGLEDEGFRRGADGVGGFRDACA
jgi:hypothetical protein